MNMFDKAQQLEMEQRERALKDTLGAAPVIRPTGACLFCDEPLAHPLRFCDVDCTRGWEAEQAARKRNFGNCPDGLNDDLSDGFVCCE